MCISLFILFTFFPHFFQSYWRLFCADLNSKSVATWLPSIYYNRQQHLLKSVLEKSGTATGTAHGDNSPDLNKRKRSIWSKSQKGLRRGSFDARFSRSESPLTGILDRKSSACSVLDSDFLGEISVGQVLNGTVRSNLASSATSLAVCLSGLNSKGPPFKQVVLNNESWSENR